MNKKPITIEKKIAVSNYLMEKDEWIQLHFRAGEAFIEVTTEDSRPTIYIEGDIDIKSFSEHPANSDPED